MPARDFRVFVSSTFTDLVEERNALHKTVFPRLRDLCSRYGARFQVVDLRWGISDEANVDQRTVRICLDEVKRCQRVTPHGPNFIVLLGDRYGWCPPPAEIPADEFEPILEHVSGEKQVLLQEWYKCDVNAVPPVYILQRREGEFVDYARWQPIETQLHDTLETAALFLPLTEKQLSKYVDSATEQEIRTGLFDAPGAAKHVLCFLRTIDGLPVDRPYAKYVDLDATGQWDERKRSKLKQLRTDLKTQLAAEHLRQYTTQWTGSGITMGHLQQLCDDVYESLAAQIEAELSHQISADAEEAEIAAHEAFGSERARLFTGRTSFLQSVSDYLQSANHYPLAIYGVGGVGKSALMARCIQRAQNEYPNAVVVQRYIGVTANASSGRNLLASLGREIGHRYGAPEMELSAQFQDIVFAFRKRIAFATAERPLIIFLDALDQLSIQDNAHQLAWLPNELPADVHMIVSTLPGDCLGALERKLPAENRIELAPMPVHEGEMLLDGWLGEAHRTLQRPQRIAVVNSFARSGQPLYLKLAFEEARLWHSYDAPREFGRDTSSIISDNLFARLESSANHGAMLVSFSLSYLASARNGMTEDELIDVLSHDTSFFDDFKQRVHHPLPENRLPLVVWSRLYFDLEPYLAERGADETALLAFYHRQLAEAVSTRYLTAQTEPKWHRRLANYFKAQPTSIETGRDTVLNYRKLSELPYQQALGNLENDLLTTLTDLSFLAAKILAFRTFALTADFTLTQFSKSDERLKRLHRLLSQTGHLLDAAPRDARQLKRLLFLQIAHVPALRTVLIANEKAVDRPYFVPWHRLPDLPGDALIRTFAGHHKAVVACCIAPNGESLVSVSQDETLIVWDIQSGLPLFTLRGHAGAVLSCAISPDSTFIVSGANDNLIKIWDTTTGTERRSLAGHTNAVTGCAVFPAGDRILSASNDGTLKGWDISTGRELFTAAGHTGRVSACAISPNGDFFVSASSDKTLIVWDAQTGQPRRTLEGHQGFVTGCAVSLDGKKILSCSADQDLILWDVESAVPQISYAGHENRVTGCAISPDTAKIISSSWDKRVRMWDLRTGAVLLDLEEHLERVNACALDHSGKFFISAGDDATVKLWDITATPASTIADRHTGWITGCAISGDGGLVGTSSNDCTAKIWDGNTGQVKHSFRASARTIMACAVDARGRRFLSVGIAGGSSSVFCDLSQQVATDGYSGTACALNSSGTIEVEGGTEGTCTISYLASEIREEQHIAMSSVGMYRLYPDKKAAAKSHFYARLRVGTVHRLTGHRGWIHACAISPDDSYVVTGSGDATLKVWDVQTGKERFTLMGHIDAVRSCAISPNGQFIVSGSADKTLKIWDAQNGKERLTLAGHTNWVNGCAVMPGAKYVISASLDSTLRVWDSHTGECLVTLPVDGPLNACAVAMDGSRLVAGGQKGLYFLNLITDQPLNSSAPVLGAQAKTREFLDNILQEQLRKWWRFWRTLRNSRE